jgi:flagellar basal-body rod protein FlgG
LGVNTPSGERFTRNGAFIVDGDGQLATADGYKIQGEGGGPLDVGGGAVSIDSTGAVLVDDQPIGRLGIVEFEDPRVLQHEGANLFMLPEQGAAQPIPAQETQLAPGMLEGSNVQAPVEMASMLLGLRAYAANQKVINSVDDTLGRLINDVGAPA